MNEFRMPSILVTEILFPRCIISKINIHCTMSCVLHLNVHILYIKTTPTHTHLIRAKLRKCTKESSIFIIRLHCIGVTPNLIGSHNFASLSFFISFWVDFYHGHYLVLFSLRSLHFLCFFSFTSREWKDLLHSK